ncbi:hypothetical protein JTE90_001098, partial [Oedothorax gibbosus]
PPQVLGETYQMNPNMVVNKDENAVVTVLFCSDPDPRRTFWEWESFIQETDSNTGRHAAEAIQKLQSRDDCYEARLTIHKVERSDSKTYTFVIENDKGRDAFSVSLEVKEPLMFIMLVGSLS